MCLTHFLYGVPICFLFLGGVLAKWLVTVSVVTDLVIERTLMEETQKPMYGDIGMR